MDEKWKKILIDNEPTWYSISNHGRVRNDKTGRILKFSVNHKGYYLVTIYHSGKRYTKSVHRLVANAFLYRKVFFRKLGKYVKTSSPFQVNHKDTNKKNNYDWNLEWCTQSYNQIHAIKYNLIKRRIGIDHHSNVYSEELIRQICSMIDADYKNKYICEYLLVPKHLVTDIRCGRSWRHISKNYLFSAKLDDGG